MPVPMLTELMKLRDEAERLLEIYTVHSDSEDPILRRRAHLDLDKFLMEHREEVTLLMLEALNNEINIMIDKTKPVKKVHLLSRIMFALRRQPVEEERVNNKYQEPVVYELESE